MRYRVLDTNGDMSLGNGSANFYHDIPAAVAQAVKTRLLLFRGEWFLDTTEGTPWMTDVLGKGTTTRYDGAIQQRIRDTLGVVALTGYSSVLRSAERALTISATITTVYGSTESVVLDFGPALITSTVV